MEEYDFLNMEYVVYLKYIVKTGDTLTKICKIFKCTIEDVIKLNALGSSISTGQSITIKKTYPMHEKTVWLSIYDYNLIKEYGKLSDDILYFIQGEENESISQIKLETNNTTDSLSSLNLEEEIYNKILKKFSLKPQLVHKCNSCGANLELDPDKHIFNCKYCGSVYLIGTEQLRSVY